MKYMSSKQIARKWGISQRRVQILCLDNRIPGVFKVGESWIIPGNAIKPNDLRKKEVL